MEFFEEISSLIQLATRDEVGIGASSFSRGGPLSPELMVTLLMFMVGDGRRRGYREMLESFWDQATLAGLQLPTDEPVSASAFCQAREKVSPGFLKCLLREVDRRFDAAFPNEALWRGRRVLAVDGSHMTLQRSPALFRAFGSAESAHNPHARISVLMNVVSKVPVDIVVDSYQASERHILTESHLEHVRAGDIVVLDRGYPGSNELAALLDAGADFVMRVSAKGTFAVVEEFAAAASGIDREIVIEPADAARSKTPILVRIIRSKRSDGDDVILITTLRSTDGFSLQDIELLYRMRWEVEEHFKAVKSDYMAQGQLHARTAFGVRQEVFAIMVFHALSRLVLAAAAAESDKPYAELSTKAACIGTFEYLTQILFEGSQPPEVWARRLIARLARSHVKPRPGRSSPRRSFKPLPKWGPRGARRA